MARIFPIGIQTFSELRERGCIYIDKTTLIYKLVEEGKYYFLSRPRRFGKSLLLSTLQSYFEGKKELFKDLAIAEKEQKWENYPVLRIDMSGAKYVDMETLQERINIILSQYESLYGKKDDSKKPSSRLTNLIESAFQKTGKQVVVLVDEYDAPLLDSLVDSETFNTMRNTMRDFYSPMKSCDSMLKFVFLTGITKFSQLSIFSELNNLNNISMDDAYCGLCGITKDEAWNNLQSEMSVMARKMGISSEMLFDKLTQKYDGYHFSPKSEDIFNPFSLFCSLSKQELGDYWFSSGTPTFLVEKISKMKMDISSFEKGLPARNDSFDVPTETADNPLPVLFQSGYLTIKNYNEGKVRPYILGYPNKEVRDCFVNLLSKHYTHMSTSEQSSFVDDLVTALHENNVNESLQLMKSFMSRIPYDAEEQNELHYKTIIYLIFSIATPYLTRCEEKSAAGRSDIVVETENSVFVFEFKLDGSVEEALKQIDEKGYLIPYSAKGKSLYKIGVNFSTKLRTIEEWQIVEC